MTNSRWLVIAAYGAQIRVAGETLEFCEAPLDEIVRDLETVENAVRKIREQLKELKNDG